MTTGSEAMRPIDEIRSELDHGYQLSQLRQSNGLRHARSRVSTVIDYVLIAIPLIAPIPNLINLRLALIPVMEGFAATVVAIAFELLLFGSAEIVLYLQDRHMRRGGYKGALRIAVFCGIVFVSILLILIINYEVPLHGWAVITLPFVSVIAIVFLSLKRWADIKEIVESEKGMRDRADDYERLSERFDEQARERLIEQDKFARTIADLESSIQAFEASTSEKDAEIARLLERIAQLREQSAEQRGQLKSRTNERPKKRSQKKRTNDDEQQIMVEILNHYRNNPKCSLGKAHSDLGYAKSTISKYLDKLSELGKAEKDENGKWSTIAPIPQIEIHTNGASK